MSDLNSDGFRRALLWMRLYQQPAGQGEFISFANCQLWTFTNEFHVFVLALPNMAAEVVVLKDEKHLYPSDTLLSQLRLLGL